MTQIDIPSPGDVVFGRDRSLLTLWDTPGRKSASGRMTGADVGIVVDSALDEKSIRAMKIDIDEYESLKPAYTYCRIITSAGQVGWICCWHLSIAPPE